VEYYNPHTGTHSSYELTVEVENDELVRINWPNGGWLDESHFSPEELEDDGSVTFTSDKGYEYTVNITSSTPCSYSRGSITPSHHDNEENDELEKDQEDRDNVDTDEEQDNN